MKKLHSVLTDDLHHCRQMKMSIHHVFNGPNRPLSEKYGFLVPLRHCTQYGSLTVCIWIRSLMSH